ncbi:MAG: tRNA (adenosine(37)-N6)-threonylcarbamoyltransferase complex dimerization subunit type 1 TsaB [Rhodothermales bacterium]|nr:tRNA (adenosine(37)-N6)-threonylcarbamoyltransferase complex dimerization subunit type 1 TsaB [Rhodothermales bacterium]
MKPTILGIETATDVCSAAVILGDRVWTRSLEGGRRHDAELLGMIDEVLRQSRQPRSGLAGVAVSSGPGSYTGLRIGVSVAKAIAEALSIPLISVPSLGAAALAGAEASPEDRIQPALLSAFPSRRGEVFAAAYRVGATDAEQVGDTLAGLPDFVLGALAEASIVPERVVGPAAARFDGLLPVTASACSAEAVARIGQVRLEAGDSVDAELFEPYYLKEFVAGVPTQSRFARLPF